MIPIILISLQQVKSITKGRTNYANIKLILQPRYPGGFSPGHTPVRTNR